MTPSPSSSTLGHVRTGGRPGHPGIRLGGRRVETPTLCGAPATGHDFGTVRELRAVLHDPSSHSSVCPDCLCLLRLPGVPLELCERHLRAHVAEHGLDGSAVECDPRACAECRRAGS